MPNPLDVDFTETLTSLAQTQNRQAGNVAKTNDDFINSLDDLTVRVNNASQRKTAYNKASVEHLTGLKQEYQNADLKVAEASATPFNDLIALFSDDTESVDKLILRKKTLAQQIRQAQDTAGFMSKTFDADVIALQNEVDGLTKINQARRQGRVDVSSAIRDIDAGMQARINERTNFFTANVDDAELLQMIQSGDESLAPVPWMLRLLEGRQLDAAERSTKRRGKVTDEEFKRSISGDQMRKLVSQADSSEAGSPLLNVTTPLGTRQFNEAVIREEWQKRLKIDTDYVTQAADVAIKTRNLSSISLSAHEAALKLYGHPSNIPPTVERHLSAVKAGADLRTDTALGEKHSTAFGAVVQAVDAESKIVEKLMKETIASQWTDKDAQKAVETYVFENRLVPSRGTFKAIDEYMRTSNTGDLITTTGAFSPMFNDLQKAYESEFQAVQQSLFVEGADGNAELDSTALNQMLFSQNKGKESGITIWNRIRKQQNWDKSAQDKLLLFSMPMAVQMLKQTWASDQTVTRMIDDAFLDSSGQFKREFLESESTIQDILHTLTKLTVDLRSRETPILAPTENLAESFGSIINDKQFLSNNVQRHYDNMDVGSKMTLQNVLGRDWMPAFLGAMHSSVAGYQYDFNIRQEETRQKEQAGLDAIIESGGFRQGLTQ